MDINIEKKDKSIIEITGELDFTDVNNKKKELVEYYKKNKEFDGFRKGNATEEIVEKQIGSIKLLEEAAKNLIIEQYPEIITKNKIEAIGLPEISITKIAENSPISFLIRIAEIPKVDLPDYTNIAKKFSLETSEVTDEDVEKTILEIKKGMYFEKNPDKKPEDIDEKDLPELADEDIKKISPKNNLNELKVMIKENLLKNKEILAKSKLRSQIADELIKEVKAEIPELIVNSELDKMFFQLEEDSKRFNTTIEDYLKHIKKSKEDLRKEWAKVAEDRVKLQLIVSEIAKKEDLKPSEEEVDKEFEKIKEQYKNADENQLKASITFALINEKVFQFLEK